MINWIVNKEKIESFGIENDDKLIILSCVKVMFRSQVLYLPKYIDNQVRVGELN